jgi:hypothetical protein
MNINVTARKRVMPALEEDTVGLSSKKIDEVLSFASIFESSN